MKTRHRVRGVLVAAALCLATAVPVGAAEYDAALAERLGADQHGMRPYVLVILKTGSTRVPDGPERDAMFAGHFANMERLAEEGNSRLRGRSRRTRKVGGDFSSSRWTTSKRRAH